MEIERKTVVQVVASVVAVGVFIGALMLVTSAYGVTVTEDNEPLDGDPESIAETAPSGGLADALDDLDDDTQQAFIRIVVGIKLGVLLLSAGILAIGFQGMTTLGGGLIAISGLAFARAGYRYWAYEHASDGSHNG